MHEKVAYGGNGCHPHAHNLTDCNAKHQFFTNYLLLKDTPGVKVEQVSPSSLINDIMTVSVAFYGVVAIGMFQRMANQIHLPVVKKVQSLNL